MVNMTLSVINPTERSMSKFDELAVLAAKYSRTFFENKRQCKRAAELLLQGYAEYLGCPLENVDFLRLNGELNITPTDGESSSPVPILVYSNAFWHFCGRIRFEGPDPYASAYEFLKLAVKYQDGSLIIREDQDFQVNLAEPATLQPFFEHLYKASYEGFSNALGKQSKRIGFIPT